MIPATPLLRLERARARLRPRTAADIEEELVGWLNESWKLLTDGLLNRPGMRKITGGTLECILAMIAVAEKSGMFYGGRRRAQEHVDVEPVDVLHCARLAGRPRP